MFKTKVTPWGNKMDKSFWFFSILAICVVLIVVGGYILITYFPIETLEVEITEKVVKRNSDSDNYLIFAKKIKENSIIVLENTDMLFCGKFNSSDIQAQLKVGKKYELVVRGRRIQLLSMYQNIITIKEIK